MSNPASRPSSVDLLISEYGSFIGMEVLSFDEDNLLSFELDGTAVTLQYRGEVVGILLKEAIEIPAEALSPAFLLALHGVNFASANNGMGTVLLDREFGGWIWLDRLDLRAMTAQILHEKLNRAARNIAFWKTQIPELIARTASEMPAATAEPTDFPMIRI